MFDHLGPAMRRALAATRASKPGDATRIIQEALAGTAAGRTDATALPPPSARQHRGLSNTFKAMRSGAAVAELRPSRQPESGGTAGLLRRSISTSSGARDYHLFVPAARRPTGLIVMLHGCKQHAEDFAMGTAMNAAAGEEGLLVAYPTQTRAANPSQCWNWFRPADQQRGAGEPHIIAEMTRALIAEHRLDGRIFVAGLSAGGAMAAVMAATYPDLYDAVGIHSGLAYGVADDVGSALGAMRGDLRPRRQHPSHTRVARQIVFHGNSDSTVVPANATALMNAARSAHGGGTVSTRRFTAGSRLVEHTAILDGSGIPQAEAWIIDGAGHYWSGGDPAGSYAKPAGPSASREMVRFFLRRPLQMP